MRAISILGTALFSSVLATSCCFAQQAPVASDDIGQMNPEATAKAFPGRGFSPYAGRNYPTRVFWGDQHVHTGWSVDAGAFGATLGPEEALRFARGEEVMSSMGVPVKLSRPLDWAAITDHSDAAGVIFEIKDGNPDVDGRSAGQALARHDGGGRRRACSLRNDQRAVEQQHSGRDEGPQARHDDLAEEHLDHGEVQRAGRVHRLHRLRVDVERGWRRQPAPQRHLPRRQGQGRRGAADDHLRQREPRRPLEMDAGLGRQDRRIASRHSAQRQPVERQDVRAEHLSRRSADPRMGRDARQVGTDVRDHPDQGRRRDPAVAVADRRVRGLREVGRGEPCRGSEEAWDDRARICPPRAAGRAEAGGRRLASTRSSSASSAAPTPTRG